MSLHLKTFCHYYQLFIYISKHIGIVISSSSTLSISGARIKNKMYKVEKNKKQDALKTQSNDHRVVTRGQRVGTSEGILSSAFTELSSHLFYLPLKNHVCFE